jgi:hypothetical protein
MACAKHLVSMVLVTSGRDVVEADSELVRFVMNPELVGIPEQYRLFLAIALGPAARLTGMFFRSGPNTVTIAGEVVYPPFAYAVSFNGAAVRPIGEISSWASASFGESATVEIDLPIGFTHTAIPGDLRTRGEIEVTMKENAANGQKGRAMLPDEDSSVKDLWNKIRDDYNVSERLHDVVVTHLFPGELNVKGAPDINTAVVHTAVGLLTKACKTFRAIELVARNGLGKDAMVLGRSLFEATFAILFILEKDSKARAAMYHAHSTYQVVKMFRKWGPPHTAR